MFKLHDLCIYALLSIAAIQETRTGYGIGRCAASAFFFLYIDENIIKFVRSEQIYV